MTVKELPKGTFAIINITNREHDFNLIRNSTKGNLVQVSLDGLNFGTNFESLQKRMRRHCKISYAYKWEGSLDREVLFHFKTIPEFFEKYPEECL